MYQLSDSEKAKVKEKVLHQKLEERAVTSKENSHGNRKRLSARMVRKRKRDKKERRAGGREEKRRGKRPKEEKD